jgi:hypothetical protein
VTWIARLTAPAAARSRPVDGKLRYRFGQRARWNGGPVGLLVMRSRIARDGRRWVKVQLPRRPNGLEGWIPADRARLRETRWSLRVSLSRRTMWLVYDGRTVYRWRIVIGAPATPTPRGLFAVDERVPQPDPNGFLGSWILHLTAFSNVLDDFGGGPGRIGIHGRGGASFADPLGSAASHGCIRMDNGAVEAVAEHALEGTPVRIRR